MVMPTVPDHRIFSVVTLLSGAFISGLLCAEQVEPDLAELTARVESYQQAVADLGGTYTQNSSELFLSLAQAQAELGDESGAIDNYREALQALRINEGFASRAQLEILAPLNELLYRQQQWEELDSNYHLAVDISTRLYGSDDPRTIAAATRLASWKIRAFQTNAWRPRGDRSVREAAEIYRRLLRDIPETESTSATRAGYHAARGLAHFYAARHAANIPVNEFQRGAPQTSSFQTCVPLILSVDGAQPSSSACQANQIADPEYFAAQQREKNNTVRRHLGNMRESFLDAIAAVNENPEATLRDRVEAMLNLGDANLLAEDYQRARRQYARAWQLLTDAGALALRSELLDQPTQALTQILDELPFDRPLQRQPLAGTISFDVTTNGELENINVDGPEAARSQENIGAIAIKLDQSVFRPRIVDGRPVASRITLPAAQLH